MLSFMQPDTIREVLRMEKEKHEPVLVGQEPWEVEEEVDNMFGVIQTSDCPACGKMHTLHSQGDGYFKCAECGFVIDERAVIEDVLGLSKFPIHCY